MTAIERIRAALDAASCGPWIGAGPSFGRPLPEYLDSVVQDCGDGDCSITICRDTETSDASYIAACNPSAMSEVLAHIDALEAENERLRAESEERLQNCAALVSENERLRSELARPESTDMTLMRTLVQSQATELERLRKDAERKPMHEGEIQAAWLGQGIEEPMPYTFELGIRSAERFNGVKGTP